jgi:signal transduction histidine kinase
MHQVLLNLFLNAIQAMPNGGELGIQVYPIVSSGLEGAPQRFIRIVISDTGKGIPANLIPRVFDPFFTTKPKGIGLGLSIAYQIIKKHEGTIQVQSEWEKGSTFDIRLPETVEAL